MQKYLLKTTLILASAGFLATAVMNVIGAIRHAEGATSVIGLVIPVAMMSVVGAVPLLVWSGFAWAACNYDRRPAAVVTFLFGLFFSGVGLWGMIYFTCVEEDSYWPLATMAVPVIAGQTLMCLLGFIWIVIALDEIENPR